MKSEMDAEGRRRFILGPVEIAIAGLLPSLLLALLITQWNSRDAKIDRMSDVLVEQVTQTALMKEQLRTLSLQLVNMPGMNDKLIRLEATTEQQRAVNDAQDRAIDELRKVRGLR